MGDTILMAAYGAADDTSTNNTGVNQFSLGESQALSKNTDVYALYTMVGNDSAGAYSLDNTPGEVAGEDMSAFSEGLNNKKVLFDDCSIEVYGACDRFGDVAGCVVRGRGRCRNLRQGACNTGLYQ